jgi:SMP-30/Gluconolactonase/LRE-like region
VILARLKTRYTMTMTNTSRFLGLLLAAAVLSLPVLSQQTGQDEIRGAPAEPTDAQDTRAQIALLEKLQPHFSDRGAVLYSLAAAHQHLGENLEALKLLKECIALGEGFDPSGDPEFAGLRTSREFTDLVDKVHRDFPVEAHARLALVTEEKNLIPEGLAWDPNRKVFYLSSLAQRKIVQITPDSHASDFVPANRDHLLPVLGIRLDPRDSSVWANEMEEEHSKGELLHFDASGTLLGRFAIDDRAKHGFNDLVVRTSGEIILTDSLNNQVYRFDPAAKSFAPLKIHRELFYPNGIALAADDKTLFVADAIGVIRVYLENLSSSDVNPGPHSTLAGADGLYWYNGSLIAIQNGIGSPRIVAFKLSNDRTRVTRTTVLENRSSFTSLPTTGAIRGSDFYFISNSHIDNLNGGKILDVTQLEPVRIAMIHLP